MISHVLERWRSCYVLTCVYACDVCEDAFWSRADEEIAPIICSNCRLYMSSQLLSKIYEQEL